MESFYTANSPYARKVRVFLREAGLAPRVTETVAATRTEESPLLAHGPTGVSLAAPEVRRGDLVLEGMATTLMDSLSIRAREFLYRRPDERSARALAYETARGTRCYAALAATLTVPPAADAPLSLGQITAAAALATADQALLAEPWRTAQPGLATWYDQVATRPSLADTLYPGWPTPSPVQSPAQSKDSAPA